MTEIEGLIHHWENKLKEMRAYLSPAEAALIILTIKHLRQVDGQEQRQSSSDILPVT